ncbi:MAG: hypothetical protein P4L84_11520 [Isosphaeraceae bacterium]|nr:hypothetical protein [Isosphaeraceae bacterium]
MARSRWKWVLLGVVLLLVAAELALNALKSPTALVRIVNRGDYPITDLTLSTGASQAEAARIEPEQSVVFQLTGRGKNPLVLKFHQFNNPMTDFEIPEFEPRRLRREGAILVLELGTKEVVRYQEPDDSPSRWQRLGERVRNTLDEAKVPDAAP